MQIPDGFLLGASTSAWQIEGAVADRGRCIWDDFAETPGAVSDGSTGEPACDHLARMDEDLDLMAWMGLDTYSFTIAWTRVMPSGTGAVSAAGLDVYDRLVDGLLVRGIEPTATLFHWDLPSGMDWRDPATADAFGAYVSVVAERLADRVTRWATMNEPWCAAFLGYAAGIHAPGLADPAGSLRAAYVLMQAHARGMDALRAAGARAPGTVVNLMPVLAEDDRSQSVAQHVDGIQNRLFLDLLAGRGIPDDVVANTAHLTDWGFATDATVLGRDPEWLGVNYYTPMRVRVGDVDAAGAVGQDVSAFPGADQLADGAVTFCPREPRTAMGWEIAPAHLGRTLRETASALPGVPLIVNENGAAFDDVRGADGTIEDGDRITYLRGHLEQTLTAREDGVPVEGYFAWSLLDNLEWGEGRTKTFGLIAVDPATMDRTPKASASWFAQVCRTRTL